jgi:hypothetical protein
MAENQNDENERQTLVDQSDSAYDKAVATPADTGPGAVTKKLALLEVLVAEARLSRFDREADTEAERAFVAAFEVDDV